MKFRSCLKGIAAAAVAVPALASAYDYSYVEGGYLNRDQPGDESGVRVAGSFDIAKPVALFAEYDSVDYFDQFSIGGLYHQPFQRGMDLVLGVSLEHVEYDHNSDTGIGLRAGVRWTLPQTKLELNPELRYVSAGDEDGLSLRVGALFPITPKLKLQGGVQFGDDDRFDLGLRYEFNASRYGW
ncbi:hypothetical protein SAMN04488038_11576 [Solimonas aquatica]|uniref:Outer membrane protein beta-barrel domain-containing protein n=1 Tax=Solimonas aquatica TaxID=489703 RepID=A0A1H9L980_9GAMM|nr:hypothetical protein [Solimonas aquatica]SER08022.1 hypothetical protein SAMN04488038_11576 [Solimonas aquatica]